LRLLRGSLGLLGLDIRLLRLRVCLLGLGLGRLRLPLGILRFLSQRGRFGVGLLPASLRRGDRLVLLPGAIGSRRGIAFERLPQRVELLLTRQEVRLPLRDDARADRSRLLRGRQIAAQARDLGLHGLGVGALAIVNRAQCKLLILDLQPDALDIRWG